MMMSSLPLFWLDRGPHRLQLLVADFSITEEAFDTALNPIRAKVSLGMRCVKHNGPRIRQ